jgi:DNA-binding response OmpR family regulator
VKILCVDDAPDVLDVLSISLQMRWPDADVLRAEDGPTALALFRNESPDLLIVDLRLPGMDGYEVIRHTRARSDVPIIILSVCNQEQDILKGLELGADSYITKPFSHLELLARVQAVLRRARYGFNSMEQVMEVGRVRLDPNTREVYVDGRAITLTPIEYSILYHLARNAGKVQTHRELLSKVWGSEWVEAPHLLAVHMSHLRSKLGDTSDEPSLILTERGIGYRMVT